MTGRGAGKRFSDNDFATFLADETAAVIETSTIDLGWSGLQAMTVEHGDDAFTTPPLNSHFLVFCIEGRSEADVRFAALVGPEESVFEVGSLCFIPAGDAAEVKLAGRFRGLHVLLSAPVVDGAVAARSANGEKTTLQGFHGRRHELIAETAEKIVAIAGRAGPETAPEADRLAIELADRILDFASNAPAPDGRRMQLTALQMVNAISYIDNHMAGDVDLAAIAAFVGATSEALAAGFVEETGVTLDVYRAERRLSIAQELLADDEGARLSDQEIAEKTGFGDIDKLNAAFRAELGVSFKDYRAGRRR